MDGRRRRMPGQVHGGGVYRFDGPNVQSLADGYIRFGASGLAGVWAEENTRESLFDAFRRKETFATTGPRIRLRFFAGYGLDKNLDEDPDMVSKAYEAGVPMGADLAARAGESPSFLVWALRDPAGAPLQRAQIIKAWMEEGKAEEKVFDVACSDGGEELTPLIPIHPERRDKRILRNIDLTELAHAFLPRLLFVEQLALARHVAASLPESGTTHKIRLFDSRHIFP